MNIIPNDPRDPEFLRQTDTARHKSGRELLDDKDLLLLACRRYRAPSPEKRSAIPNSNNYS